LRVGGQHLPILASSSERRGNPNFLTAVARADRLRTAFILAMIERITRAIVLLAATMLTGCGVVAAPCRVTSAVIDMVPLVGHVAATPTDACAEAIDPK
jgi:hypothetical protein